MKIDITRSRCCSYAFTITPSMGAAGDTAVDADGLSLARIQGGRRIP